MFEFAIIWISKYPNFCISDFLIVQIWNTPIFKYSWIYKLNPSLSMYELWISWSYYLMVESYLACNTASTTEKGKGLSKEKMAEIQGQIEADRKKLENQKDMAEEEKKKVEEDLQRKETELASAQ